MKSQRTLVILALLAAAAAVSAVSAHAATGFKLVVNPGNPTQSLTRAEVARLFLKKVSAWPDGRPVAAVDQERSSEVRKSFSETVHQKDPDAISAYWQVLVFSGREVPPKTLKSDEEVLAFVRATPGGVGYVSTAAHADGVRVIAVQ